MPRVHLKPFISTGLRTLSIAASTAVVAAALAAPATAGPSASHQSGPSSEQQRAVHIVTARLNGHKEVPPADPDGRGRVTIRLRPGAGKVCARATWHHIGRPTMAHIHRGRPGVSGTVVVDLTGSVTGGSHCATGVSRALIRHIAQHPRRFYFNIHTNAYPAGAIRGQLH
jgi:hypothetical protein